MKSRAVFFVGNKKAEVREIDIPDPGPGQVQAKCLANGICMAEVFDYNNKHFKSPALVGHEGLCVVTKTGKGVSRLKEGDYIGGYINWSEYVNVGEYSVVKVTGKPADPACYLLEPASCAVNTLASAAVYPGDKAIVFGAGYMGLLLIQLLGTSPLSELVVVDVKPENLQLAKEYGATRVINPAAPDDRAQLEEYGDEYFDITFECSGAKEPLEMCTKLVRKGGKLVIYSWHHDPRLIDTSAWHVKGIKVLNTSPNITADERPFRSFVAADRLMASGKLDQSRLITHRYKIDDMERAMEESTVRGRGFIKSVLVF